MERQTRGGEQRWWRQPCRKQTTEISVYHFDPLGRSRRITPMGVVIVVVIIFVMMFVMLTTHYERPHVADTAAKTIAIIITTSYS